MTTVTYPANLSVIVGGATAAKQDNQTALLTTIDADTSTLVLKDFATSAKQDTGNSSLTSIDGKFTTLNAKDFATAAKQDTGNVNLGSIDTKLTSQATAANQTSANTKLDTLHTDLVGISSNTNLGVIDQIDATPLLNCASTAIPASSGNPVTVVASLAAACKKIISVEDIGSYIGLYTGVALSEVLYCILPLGGGEIQVSIPIATRISLRAMENTAITSSKIALNFLG